jgi:hypothetical protein
MQSEKTTRHAFRQFIRARGVLTAHFIALLPLLLSPQSPIQAGHIIYNTDAIYIERKVTDFDGKVHYDPVVSKGFSNDPRTNTRNEPYEIEPDQTGTYVTPAHVLFLTDSLPNEIPSHPRSAPTAGVVVVNLNEPSNQAGELDSPNTSDRVTVWVIQQPTGTLNVVSCTFEFQWGSDPLLPSDQADPSLGRPAPWVTNSKDETSSYYYQPLQAPDLRDGEIAAVDPLAVPPHAFESGVHRQATDITEQLFPGLDKDVSIYRVYFMSDVPEPSTLVMGGIGAAFIALGAFRHRRRRHGNS